MPMLDPHDHERAMQAAREVLEGTRSGGRRLWSDWLVVGAGFLAARAEAMAIAGTNRPKGRAYNKVMSDLLAEHGLSAINETPRRCLLNIMEDLQAVERWRAEQEDPDGLNHPTWVWQQFKKKGRHARRKATRAELQGIELAHARERIVELEDELRGKQAEIDRFKARQGDRVEVPVVEDGAALLRWVLARRAERAK